MQPKKIHLMGIGGVGMAGLAYLLHARGHSVSGCDLSSSARTDWLEACGIPICLGHAPEHAEDADLLIVTSAVPPDAPERRAFGTRVRRRGEVLAELVNAADAIAVCGSHGKTTTATWTAKLLIALGEDVTWCIGGETGDFPVAGHAAAPSRRGVLVVEADESDGTLECYHARTLVVTNCEYDHPDHFRTPEDYFACYARARRQAQDVVDGTALSPLPCVEALENLAPHNRRNARAAVEVALRRGFALEKIIAALPSVVAALPDRRFQRVWPPTGAKEEYVVITDYGHHPTEMRCAVEAARKICRGTLRVLFQPHRPSRTKALMKDFPAAFAGTDETVLCPTYAAFEPPLEGGDVADLYRACREAGTGGRLYLARTCAEAWEHAARSMRPEDVTLILGAGDIVSVLPRVREDLSDNNSSARARGARHFWLGGGTNTWRSDLALNEVYERTTTPAGGSGAELVAAHPNLCPWMAGIPGSVGGWIKMNAGAFGHSFSEVLLRVKVDGVWREAAACGFAYRHSDIDGEIQDYLLKPDPIEPPVPDAAAYRARRKSFPPGTWGSVFKNPPNDFAGRLLEASGAKGLRVGGAYVWAEHANVIVRGENATPSDVLALTRLMHNAVYFRFGVSLEPEIVGLAICS